MAAGDGRCLHTTSGWCDSPSSHPYQRSLPLNRKNTLPNGASPRHRVITPARTCAMQRCAGTAPHGTIRPTNSRTTTLTTITLPNNPAHHPPLTGTSSPTPLHRPHLRSANNPHRCQHCAHITSPTRCNHSTAQATPALEYTRTRAFPSTARVSTLEYDSRFPEFPCLSTTRFRADISLHSNDCEHCLSASLGT